jgi:sulfur-carrier protein
VTSIRVVLPVHLRNLAKTGKEVTVTVPGGGDDGGGDGDGVTQRAVLDALEQAYPVLLGTIRDRQTGKRRAFVRFYACEQDLSNEPPDAPLPAAVAAALAAGTEPFLVVGAMAGG